MAINMFILSKGLINSRRLFLLIGLLFIMLRIAVYVCLSAPPQQLDFLRKSDNEYGIEFLPRNRVDIRIVVLTFDRAKSLSTCLNNINNMVFESDEITRSLDIWLDRDTNNQVDNATFAMANYYEWNVGSKTVNVHREHGGVFAQWMQTWIPEEKTSEHQEIVLFVEDDIDISKYSWRWMKKVREFYSNRTDIAMYCLQDDNAVIQDAKTGAKVEIDRDPSSPVFLYAIPGSWGCSPHEQIWREFRIWFLHQQELQKLGDPFKPYVYQAPLHTGWYKVFVKEERQETMWTMWFIYYCRERKLYGLYSNLPQYMASSNVSLSINRREAGLHYKLGRKATNENEYLMEHWEDKFTNFPVDIPRYGFDGKRIH